MICGSGSGDQPACSMASDEMLGQQLMDDLNSGTIKPDGAILEDKDFSDELTKFSFLEQVLRAAVEGRLGAEKVPVAIHAAKLPVDDQLRAEMAEAIWFHRQSLPMTYQNGPGLHADPGVNRLSDAVGAMSSDNMVTKKELLLVMHRKNLVEHALVPPIRTGPGIRQSHPDDAILAKMYFKQEKYNLFREASEGWAKVLVSLDKFADGAMQNKDDVIRTFNETKQLFGCFSLDPNKGAAVVLHSFAQQPKNLRFLDLLDNFDAQTILHNLGWTLECAGRIEDGELPQVPKHLYRMAASVIKHFSRPGVLEQIVPYLPSRRQQQVDAARAGGAPQAVADAQTACKQHNRTAQAAELSKVSKSLEPTLPQPSVRLADVVEESATAKVASVANYPMDAWKALSHAMDPLWGDEQGAQLVVELLKIGEWGMAKQLMNWLKHTVGLDPLLHVEIVDVMCNKLYHLLLRKMPRAVVAMLWDGDKRVSVADPPVAVPQEEVPAPDVWPTEAEELAAALGPFVGRHEGLWTVLVRWQRWHLIHARQQHAAHQLEEAHCQSVEVEVKEHVAEILLPAMLLLGPKPAAAHAMWNLMGMFSFETRSNIYTSVTELLTQEPKQHPDAPQQFLARVYQSQVKAVKHLAKRIVVPESNASKQDKEQKVRGPQRLLTKMACTNPFAVASEISASAGGYSAMQAVWLELMRMLPELAFDAFNQQLLRTLQLKWEQRKLCEPGNQLEPTQWLQSMPKWAAQMLLLHGHKAGGCLRPLMQVALEGLSGEGTQPHRRFRLYDPEPYRFISEIIDRVGFQRLPAPSEDKAGLMAGGFYLKFQSQMQPEKTDDNTFRHDSKRGDLHAALMKALMARMPDGQPVAIKLYIGLIRAALSHSEGNNTVFGSRRFKRWENNDEALDKFMMVHETIIDWLNQLTALLKYSLDRKTYASLLPPLAATLQQAGDRLPLELVWQLYRPAMERVPLPSPPLPAGKGKTQQAEDGEVQADAGAGAAAADPVVPATPTAAERGDDAGPAGLWTWNQLRQMVKSYVPKVSLAGISEDFYLWFWSLSYGHLHFPGTLYEEAIKRCEAKAVALRNGRFEKLYVKVGGHLKTERDKHRQTCEEVARSLQAWRDSWLAEVFPSDNGRMDTTDTLLLHLVLPRAKISEEDALFCAEFVKAMVLAGTDYLGLLPLMNRMFMLLHALPALTNQEAKCVGIFFSEFVKFVELYRADLKRYEHELAPLRPLCSSSTLWKAGAEPFSRVKWLQGCVKLQSFPCTHIVSVLKRSRDRTSLEDKNIFTFLQQILQVCPAVRPFATVLLQHINPFQKELSKQDGPRAHGVTQRLTAMVPITGYLHKVLAENRLPEKLDYVHRISEALPLKEREKQLPAATAAATPATPDAAAEAAGGDGGPAQTNNAAAKRSAGAATGARPAEARGADRRVEEAAVAEAPAGPQPARVKAEQLPVASSNQEAAGATAERPPGTRPAAATVTSQPASTAQLSGKRKSRDGDKHGEAGPSKRPSLGDVPARAAAPEHRVKPEEAHAGNRNGRAEAGPSRLGNERRAAGEESRSRQRADRGVDVAQGHSASRRDSGHLTAAVDTLLGAEDRRKARHERFKQADVAPQPARKPSIDSRATQSAVDSRQQGEASRHGNLRVEPAAGDRVVSGSKLRSDAPEFRPTEIPRAAARTEPSHRGGDTPREGAASEDASRRTVQQSSAARTPNGSDKAAQDADATPRSSKAEVAGRNERPRDGSGQHAREAQPDRQRSREAQPDQERTHESSPARERAADRAVKRELTTMTEATHPAVGEKRQRQPITFQKTTVATANNRLRIQSEARTARFGEPSAEDAANARTSAEVATHQRAPEPPRLVLERPAAEEAGHHRARSRSNDRSRVDTARRQDSPGRDRGADRRHRSGRQESQRSRSDEGARHDRPTDRPPPGLRDEPEDVRVGRDRRHRNLCHDLPEEGELKRVEAGHAGGKRAHDHDAGDALPPMAMDVRNGADQVTSLRIPDDSAVAEADLPPPPASGREAGKASKKRKKEHKEEKKEKKERREKRRRDKDDAPEGGGDSTLGRHGASLGNGSVAAVQSEDARLPLHAPSGPAEEKDLRAVINKRRLQR